MERSNKISGTKRRFRVALITQWYPPEPAYQPQWIAEALRDNDCDVTVITGNPNYPEGKTHSGYKAFETSEELINRIVVKRNPLIPSHSNSAIGRIANYVSWAISTAILSWRRIREADAVLVYSSPITAAWPARVARFIKGPRYAVIVQDIWPDSIFASGFLTRLRDSISRSLLEWLCARSYRRANEVIAISEGAADLLAQRGIDRKRLTVIYNWRPEDDGRHELVPPAFQSLRNQLGLTADHFLLAYAGNLGSAQALENAILAIGSISPAERCHLVLIGTGVEKARLTAIANKVAPEQISFLDPVPIDQLSLLIADADAQLVSLADEEIFSVTIPSKLQAALAAGAPIIVSGRGDVADIVESARAGYSARPGCPEDLARAILDLRNAGTDARLRMGENARDYYETKMSERAGITSLVTILKRMARR